MFAERLRELRRQRGLTQPELAERVGLSHSTVALLEQGRHEPMGSTVVKICRAFGVSSDWLLDLDSRGEEVQGA